MNQHEKYLFDLRGYIVVRNATTTAQIDDLSTRLEMHRNEKNPLPNNRKLYLHGGSQGSGRGVTGRTNGRRTVLLPIQ